MKFGISLNIEMPFILCKIMVENARKSLKLALLFENFLENYHFQCFDRQKIPLVKIVEFQSIFQRKQPKNFIGHCGLGNV